MDQVKMGKFIATKRHEANLTQKQLAEKLGVTDRAVSKWERGVCFMDISLLKPISELLGVNIVDLLSGEMVPKEKREEKYEESMEEIIKLNEVKSKAFGFYGFMLAYLFFIFYKVIKGICYYDIVSIFLFFLSFRFYHLYKLGQDKSNQIMSLICIGVGIFLLIIFVQKTW